MTDINPGSCSILHIPAASPSPAVLSRHIGKKGILVDVQKGAVLAQACIIIPENKRRAAPATALRAWRLGKSAEACVASTVRLAGRVLVRACTCADEQNNKDQEALHTQHLLCNAHHQGIMGHAIRLTRGTCTRLVAAVATMTGISKITGGAHTLSFGSVATSQSILKPLRSWLR
jgi:hypothetical protein